MCTHIYATSVHSTHIIHHTPTHAHAKLANTRSNTHIYTRAHIDAHTTFASTKSTHANTHTNIHITRIHTHTCTPTHVHTHTHTCTLHTRKHAPADTSLARAITHVTM